MAQPQRANRHRRTVHREAPVIDVSSRRAAEESAWRIKSVKLERDRHAQQRHLNPLNMADTIGKLVDSFKGRHRDAILVIGEDTLEVFVESPEAAAPTKKLRKGLSKVFGRKDSDSEGEAECMDTASGVGEAEEALEGHLFSVGVAFAQILQLSQHDKAITIYYHPNSFSSTQSVRSNLANCWRFTVALDTPEEADSVMADIRLQLARYAQGIHWVQKNFLLDESINAVLVTAGPIDLLAAPQQPEAGFPHSSQASHVVLQMQPQFDVPFAAPESWNQQAVKGEAVENVRVFLQTPTGCCHVDITRAVLHRHVQGERGHFYVTATATPASKVISLEALEKRNMEIDKYLVHSTTNRPHRLSLSRTPSIAGDSQMDDTSVAPTTRDESSSPTPRTLSLSQPPNTGLGSPTMSEMSNPDLSYQRSPGLGKPRGGFAFSDRPLLGGNAEELARSKSFTGQELRQRPSNLSIATGRETDEEITQAMRRVSSWSSMNGSPRKSKASKALTIQANTDGPLQTDSTTMLDTDRDMAPPRRLGSVRFAQHLSPDAPSSPSVTGQARSSMPGVSMPTVALRIRLHCQAQRVARQSTNSPSTAESGSQVQSNSQLKPLIQLAAQQPQLLSDIVSQPAVWIAYTPLTLILLLLLCLLRTPVWSSLLTSAVCTSICVLYAAQQRLLLGRQEQIAVLRARKAVAGGLADQQEALTLQADKAADKPLPPTQILLTLLGAEVTDSVSAEETDETYDDESGSELSLEVGAEAGAEFEAQQRLHAASVAQSGPATATGEPAAVPPHQSMLRRFSKDHAVSEDIQKRFMIAVDNDEKAAKTRVQDWLEWKTKHGLADCLRTPQPNFDIMKKAIFHGVVCISKSDHPIRIMKVGDMRAAWKKIKAAGLNSDAALRHFGFVEEYLWQVLDPRPLPLGTAIWIVDLGGMGLSDLGSEAFQFYKRMSVEVGMHYPERLCKLVLLNAPSFFSLLWKICEPIMPGSTRNKVKVVRSHQELVAALADECDQSAIPSEYGGTSPTPLYDSQIEQELTDFVHNIGQ